ncbi:Nephrocystin-3 [Dactylellina cionopaga]|nr:Nephrocystin-3 [Dactylellina cionopaga]
MDYIHEYRLLGGLVTARDQMTMEVKAAQETLEGYHPALISLSRILATVQAALGQFEPAAVLLSQRLKDLERMPPSFREPKDFTADISRGVITKFVIGGTDTSAIKAAALDEFLRLELQDQLATLRRQQGLSAGAQAIYGEILGRQENAFGKEHIMVIRTLQGVGVTLTDRGDHSTALPYLSRSLLAALKTLGRRHPETIRMRNNLAVTYGKLGSYREAEKLLEPLHEELIGSDSLRHNQDYANNLEGRPESTLVIHCNRISILCIQGKLAEAEKELSRVVNTMEMLLTRSHPATQTGIHNLGVIFAAQGRHKEAQKYLQESVSTLRDLLGQDHPTTQEGSENLSAFQRGQVSKDLTYQFGNLTLTAAERGRGVAARPQLRLILRQLDESFTPKRGTCLLDPKWIAELSSRFKEPIPDDQNEKEKKM